MAPVDNLQELVPLTNGAGGPANDDYDEPESQNQKKTAAAVAAAAATLKYPDDGGKGHRNSVYDKKMCTVAIMHVVGFSTLLRFPYVCFKYGGGTFFIPYIIVMVLVGYPLFIMEIGIGQKLRYNSITIWTQINPQLRGVGLMMFLISVLMASYYGNILAWCVKHIADVTKFPDVWFPNDKTIIDDVHRSSSFWYEIVLNSSSSLNDSSYMQINQVGILFFTWFSIALILAFLWIMTGNKYIKMIGNYSNSIIESVPFFIQMMALGISPFLLLILTIVMSGYGYTSFLYITSVKLKDLLALPIWIDAVIQVFLSLSLVHGSWTSFGSLSRRKANFLLTATIVMGFSLILVFVWSWFLVCTIIPNVLQNIKSCVTGSNSNWNGFKDIPQHAFSSNSYDSLIASRQLDNALMNLNIQECNMDNQFKFASNGFGLLFIALKEFTITYSIGNNDNDQLKYILNIPQSIILAICMSWLIHLISWFVWTLAGTECLKNVSKYTISGMLCAICFAFGLPFTTRAGIFWMYLYSDVLINSCLTVLALCEILVVIFIYGYKQFLLDTYDMTGYTFGYISAFIWKHITPVLLILAFSSILTIGILDKLTYTVWCKRANHLITTGYSSWAQLLIWSITALCLLLILTFCFVDYQNCLNFKCIKSLNKDKKTKEGHIKRSNNDTSKKNIITDIDFDDFPESENDEEIDTSMTQAPVCMYKIEVLDSWKSARGQVYL
ncbi:Sodium:neurotransmitter symporter [Cinara cedri]|uniref:Sodium-dependent nutrient amino acid transporter 1 n=1 Tax=Cinara cedri TaxID=506608 RepID=A0A5E4NFW7_9HEMI|nr:Sodium:neurotransmitter symporter [Cinara cedri]